MTDDKIYTVWVRLEVMRVEDDNRQPLPNDSNLGQHATGDVRMVATRVLAAYCECKAGADSQCHHVAMALYLGRLLQLSSDEIRLLNPVTSTARTCQWILNHCKGGRGAADNYWWGRTLPEVHVEFSRMRDPKLKGLASDMVGEPEQTAGVVQVDRIAGYSPHPSLGPWAEKRRHFDEGISISSLQSESFGKFFASVREAKKKGHRSKRTTAGNVPLAIDFLPPVVRGPETQEDEF